MTPTRLILIIGAVIVVVLILMWLGGAITFLESS
jgi:hypothetical protein